MRKTFQATMADLLVRDDRVIVLLGDIGVWGFREEMAKHAGRVLNFGILEQSMISFAAGLSASGYLPVVHSIAPFLIERSLEQIKIDFGYQQLSGNLVSVGASFDYSALGGTHHAPGDVDALLSIPGVQVLLPGHPDELDQQLRQNYANSRLSYYRLSENPNESAVAFGASKIQRLKSGTRGTVACLGPVLDTVVGAVGDEDLTITYLNELSPGAINDLLSVSGGGNLVVVEPFYQATTAQMFYQKSTGSDLRIAFEGIPREFSHSYGSFSDQMVQAGFTTGSMRARILRHLT